MYVVKVDGQMIFSSALYDDVDKLLSPSISLETSNAGNFSFVLSPNHSKRDIIHKMKSIITVEHDGAQIFRGRASSTELDIYNQLSVYCEGEKTFLNDSVFAPTELSGNVRAFFRSVIENHNTMVDEERQFTVGIIDAVDEEAELTADSRQQTRTYWTTSDIIQDSLIDVYGGYLRTRTDGGVHYIDWVKEYGGTNTQPIEFSVNLLDMTSTDEASEVFTVLIPLGISELDESGNYSAPLTIESVNGGLNYIQDDEAVARYGKIWRTQTWVHEKDPAELLVKGRKYLKYGAALETMTIHAVDMHFLDESAQAIHVGDMVRIISEPHGIDKIIVCSKIEIDLYNPENTTYTLGEPPKMLTDDFAVTEEEVKRMGGGGGGGRKSQEEEISDIIRWADYLFDDKEAKIQLSAGELNNVTGRVSEAEIRLNGVEATMELKVSKDGLISAINMSPESIVISASKINLNGYVTTSKLSAELASITSQISTSITTSSISAATVRCTNLYVGGGHADFTTLRYTDADGKAATLVVLAQ